MNFLKNLVKKPLALVGGVIAIVVIIAIIVALVNNAALAPLKNSDAVLLKGKADKIKKLAPKEYWDWMEEETGKSVDDLIEAYEENLDDQMDSLEERYGKNIKTSYKITKRVNMPKGMVKKIAESLNDKYDIKESSVNAACLITYDKTTKGSEWVSCSTDREVALVQIGMSWYQFDYAPADDGEISATLTPDF